MKRILLIGIVVLFAGCSPEIVFEGPGKVIELTRFAIGGSGLLGGGYVKYIVRIETDRGVLLIANAFGQIHAQLNVGDTVNVRKTDRSNSTTYRYYVIIGDREYGVNGGSGLR